MAHRLWFRLDDVLPLAEHAMACPTHRRTGAQTRARAASGPALIWTGTAVLDVLTSTGVPAWYRDRGTVHAADAHTWRHLGTGRYGTAGRDGYHTAYLPLNAQIGPEAPAITVLRAGHRTGRHWVTVDIDPADQHLITPQRVRLVEHRDTLIPPDSEWAPATVTCPTVAGHSYPALVADGYTSAAGSELPRFDRPTVEQMITDLEAVHANPDRHTDAMPGEYPRLRLAGDVLVAFEEHDQGDTTTYREADRVRPDQDGRYAVGAYLWPWQLTHP
jgi:hypothetical protein